MARRKISLPDDLDEQARSAGVNVSALTQRALVAELERRSRMARLDAWFDDLDAVHGAPSPGVVAEAEVWMRSARPAAHRVRPGRPTG